MTIPRCSEPNCIAPATDIVGGQPERERLVCTDHAWDAAADGETVRPMRKVSLPEGWDPFSTRPGETKDLRGQIEHLKRLLGPKKEER